VKTTKEERAEWRHQYAHEEPDVLALLDDLDEALASAEAWKARCEREYLRCREWENALGDARRFLEAERARSAALQAKVDSLRDWLDSVGDDWTADGLRMFCRDLITDIIDKPAPQPAPEEKKT